MPIMLESLKIFIRRLCIHRPLDGLFLWAMKDWACFLELSLDIIRN